MKGLGDPDPMRPVCIEIGCSAGYVSRAAWIAGTDDAETSLAAAGKVKADRNLLIAVLVVASNRRKRETCHREQQRSTNEILHVFSPSVGSHGSRSARCCASPR